MISINEKICYIFHQSFFHLALNLKAVHLAAHSAFRILPTVPQTFPHFWIPHFTFRIPHSAIPHFTNTLTSDSSANLFCNIACIAHVAVCWQHSVYCYR